MEKFEFTTTGEAPRIVRFEGFAFHDAKGRIRHMHHHVVFEGAQSRKIEDIVDEARADALALGNDVSKLRVLHVREAFNPRVMHRVDVKRGVLMELQLKSRGKRNGKQRSKRR